MATTSRRGKLVQADDHDDAYAASYRASGLSPTAPDRSSEFDYRGWSDADLAREAGWAYYRVSSNLRPGDVHRLRAINQELRRRRREGES